MVGIATGTRETDGISSLTTGVSHVSGLWLRIEANGWNNKRFCGGMQMRGHCTLDAIVDLGKSGFVSLLSAKTCFVD